ncbi:hypothetical protein WN944_002546 [Citrus x changshan-huyou]|uniref:Ubiquitin-like domain-containing protein n=1 Tax=Citrus x changshan-huyou TaxID=2935761 RepID=A0AAP0QRW2_9ROSI
MPLEQQRLVFTGKQLEESSLEEADLRQDVDRENHHSGGGELRHDRQREDEDSGQGGDSAGPAEAHLRPQAILRTAGLAPITTFKRSPLSTLSSV